MPLMPLGIPDDIDNYFFNREDKLRYLNSFFEILRKKGSHNLLLTGARGVGKTFLLRKMINDIPSDIMVSYLDINRIHGMHRHQITADQIMKEILGIMIKDIRSRRKYLSEALDNNVAMIHNKIKKNDYDFEMVADLLEIELDEEDPLTSFVVQFPQKVVENSFFTGYVLIMDDFQLMEEYLLTKFFNSEQKVSYLLSGPLTRASPLITQISSDKRLMHISLGPFSREELGNYLKEKAESLRFTQEGIDRFYEFTEGYPAYINSTINTLGHNVMYGERTMREIFKFKIEQIAVKWLGIWATLSSPEKEIVIKLVDGGPLRWTEVLNKVDFSRGTLNKYMELLINRGIVVKRGQLYGVEDVMLQQWLRHKKEVDGFYPW